MQAYGGAHFVSIAVHNSCYLSLVWAGFLNLFSSASLIAFKTRFMDNTGIFFNFSILLMKSFESLIYDHPFCIIGFRMKIYKFIRFSVVVTQLEITAFQVQQIIFHGFYAVNRASLYYLAFKCVGKAFELFWLIKSFRFKFKNMLLLLSTRSVKIFLLKIDAFTDVQFA